MVDYLVEAGGIEPPSERKTSSVSPSAVRVLGFAQPMPTNRLHRAIPEKFHLLVPRERGLEATLAM